MKARVPICLIFIRMTSLSVQAAGEERAKENKFSTTVFYDDYYLKEFQGKLQPGMPPTDFIVGLVNSMNLRLGLLKEVNVSLSLLSVLNTPSLVRRGNFYHVPSSLEKFIEAKKLESTVQQADIVCIITSNYIYDDEVRVRVEYYVHKKGGVCGNKTKFILVRLYEGAWDNIARLAEPVVLVLGCQLNGSVPSSECSPKLIREPPYRFQDCVGKNIKKTLTSKTNCPKQTSITIPRYNRTILPWDRVDNTTRCANRRSVKFDCSTQTQLDDCFYACCKTRDEQDHYATAGYRVILDGGSCGKNKTCINGQCQENYQGHETDSEFGKQNA